MAYKKRIRELPTKKHGIINLLRSKCLIYCGGGYFGEQPKHKVKWSIRNFCRHIVIGIIAVSRNIPIAIIGVEFGPLSISWFRKWVVWLAKRAQVVVVRNDDSKKFLEHNGVYNVAESVDAVLTIMPPNNHKNNNDVLIHIPNIRYAPEQYMTFTKVLIKALSCKGIKNVTFIEDTCGQYLTGYESLFSLFDNANIRHSVLSYSGTESLVERISDADYVISTKLHVGITGAAMNKNVLAIYNHPKTQRFHKQIGNDANCLPMSASEAEMENAINHFFDVKYTLPTEIREKALITKNSTIGFVHRIITNINKT
jgi:polysaccharide pyruvyl transferase WcaK-like protein